MRHRVAGRRLNRSKGHRTALRRALVTELFRIERIRTTEAKAKAIRSQAEKLITLAKRGLVAEETVPERGVHARRLASGRLNDPLVVKKLFEELGPRYADRPGGYTRIIKLGPRKGDAAAMAVIELVED
jgi:large subunit ribosomal protein L17